MLVEHYGEPYADSSAVPTYYVAKKRASTSRGAERRWRRRIVCRLRALHRDGTDGEVSPVPSFLRESVIKETVNLMPTRRDEAQQVRDRKRLLEGVSLPKVDRYCTG
jgi:asparagine synthase (glutamine-hydrolysing)